MQLLTICYLQALTKLVTAGKSALPLSGNVITSYSIHYTKLYDGEMTGAAVSVWYNGTTMTELEPMGTWDWIEPGRSSAFEVKWYLQEMKFPDNGKADLPAVTNLVKACK